jgi:predicted lipoprotein with Yx(FWY)xxD motif
MSATHFRPALPRLTVTRFAVTVAALGLAAAACGGATGGGNARVAAQATPSNTGAPAGGAMAVTVTAHSGPLGTYLTNSAGMSLYMFAADKSGKSSCNTGCVQYWSPLVGDSAQTDGAANSAMTGTTIRSDGSKQITYGNHPLYTYVGDTKPGDTNGQDKDLNGGKWWLVNPSGNPINGAAASSSSSGTSSGWS